MDDVPPLSPVDEPAAPRALFVSHSSRDADMALAMVTALEAAGVSCWIAPREIPAGSDYAHEIMSGINGCVALLLIFSRHSIDSNPVKREVERARNRGVPVIPVRLENVAPSPSMEFLIATSQRVDAFPPPVDRHLENIVAAVKKALVIAHESPKADPDAAPKYVGPYRILELIGEGGMGTVYKAEQRSPVKRIVAIKVIRLGLGTAEVLARFEAERQALARMNHPHVARVLDADADEQGRPLLRDGVRCRQADHAVCRRAETVDPRPVETLHAGVRCDCARTYEIAAAPRHQGRQRAGVDGGRQADGQG